MKTQLQVRNIFSVVILLVTLLFLAALAAPLRAEEHSSNGKQKMFATSDEAIKAFIDIAKAKDRAALHELFGPMIDELQTGDPVEDTKDFQEFCSSVSQMCTPTNTNNNTIVLNIGAENWPFPIPVVKENGKWYFNTAAGKEEIINRNIGEDELNTISVCRRFVQAEREYINEDHDGSGVLKYAEKFKSAPGKRDGLYWESKDNEPLSPFGPLIAEAQEAGYSDKPLSKTHRAFHGYFFKILTQQGSDAPGGKYDYIINGHMVAGFAMIAYPAHWGESGVMTFIVNQQGQVFQRNLGDKTLGEVAKISEFNPDSTWTPVAPGESMVK